MIGSVIMLQLAVTFVLFLCSSYVHGQNVVYLDNVQLNGTLMTTRNGRNITAYLGIRYAQPPISWLRFLNPKPWRYMWPEVLSADTDGNECPQFNDDGELIGDEDCLFLNVYSPNTSPEIPYPTMVYFHGGYYFLQGSGSSTNAGPEYLLDKDIILVTVNYRLGVLGFLSTGDAEAPGNFGLKDQIIALKWVQENILKFGGNPKKVTIFGQGAGGVSTGFHAVFDASRDLFHQYISQSGNALSFWVFDDIEFYKKRAFDLGSYLNCPTSNSRRLLNCLRTFPAYDLVNSTDIFGNTNWVFLSWGPTLEPKKLEGSFITDYPLHTMMRKAIKDCPAIVGNVLDEGLLLTAAYYANEILYNSMRENLSVYLKNVTTILFDNPTDEYMINTKNYYFNGGESTDKKTFIQNMTNFVNDRAFELPFNLLKASMRVWMQAPYLYKFNYRGTVSKTSVTLGNNDNIGVSPGDDLIYLFPIKTTNITLNESDEKMIDILVDFWTSFAYTGVPTSEYTSDPNVWKPNVRETMEVNETIIILNTMKVLNIGQNSISMKIEEP